MSTDRIEKRILLRATRSRVWRALAEAGEFGKWFGVRFDGPFVPGEAVRGVMVGTAVDEALAAEQRKYGDIPFEIVIDRVEPERLFSFRWHPGIPEPGIEYAAQEMTLVTFALEEVKDGVMLTLTESGFDRVPVARRAQVFEQNAGGWAMMTGMLGRYVAQAE